MNSIPPQQLLEALKWRYATKQFDPQRKIPADVWSALEETLVLTPSSYGLQPWKFLILQDPSLRQKLVPVSWGQKQVADASHLVVMTVIKKMTAQHVDRFLSQTSQVRGVPVESMAGYRKMMISDVVEGPRSAVSTDWAIRQAYIALGNFMTSAALLGVDTCPMEGFEVEKYDDLLGLREIGWTTAVVCPAGYRSSGDKYASLAKVRFAKTDVIEYR